MNRMLSGAPDGLSSQGAGLRCDDGPMDTDDRPPTSDTDEPEPRRAMTVYGRQGSPTVSVALPFSKIVVEENAELHAAVVELAELVHRLADASALPRNAGRAGLDAVAEQAAELLARLSR